MSKPRKPDTNTLVRLILALAAILLAPPTQAAGTLDKVAQSGTITLGYRHAAPPFSYVDDKEQPIGYSIDICARIVDAVRRELKRPDITVKYVPVSTANRIPALLSGEIDLECATTTNTAERRKEVAFTIPTFIAAMRVMAKETSGISSIHDLAGKSVVTTQGTTGERLLGDYNKNHALKATQIPGKSDNESFALLEAGKAVAFLTDDVILYSQRATSKTPEAYAISRDPLTIEPLAIMLRKDDPGFKKMVDREVSRIIIRGEIQGLYRKWFESPIPPHQHNLKMPMSYMLRDSFKAPTDWVPN